MCELRKVISLTNCYLYLDESGTFDERNKKSLPSIVGGFLSEKNCTEKQATDLLRATKNQSENFSAIDIAHFHAMENIGNCIGEFVTALLENMSQKNFRFIVFENAKDYTSINSDVTYLNVFAEGIVNLMQYLLARTTDEIFLHVVYASRLNVAERDAHGLYRSLDEKAYLERIEERIDWRMLRLKSSERKRIQKSFTVGKADKFAPLMLADAVCFGFRGGLKYLPPTLQARIKNLPTLTFRLPEKISWQELQNLLIENRIGETIYSWYMRGTAKLRSDYEEQFQSALVDKLKALSSSARKFQYDAILQFVGILVDARDFDAAKKFIQSLDEKFFPLLKENDFDVQETFFDVHFYRLTVATHEGNTLEEQREIALCRKILPTLPATYEKMDYFLKYKLREVEYLKNIYDFERAIEELNRLEKILTSTVELMTLIDDLNDLTPNMRSTTLGKVLGSRAATKIYLAATKPALLFSAREDLERAAEQFSTFADKARQFQLRSMLETVAGNFQQSLTWLGKAFGAEKNPNPAKILSAIKNFAGIKTFGLLHYANLMAAAMAARHPLGLEMFAAWTSLNAEELLINSTQYPVPIILWRAGKCRALQGLKSAKNFYDDAAKILLANPANLTLFSEGILVEADRFATLDKGDNQKSLRRIQAICKNFFSLPLPPSMRETFGELQKFDAAAKKLSAKDLRGFFAGTVKKIPVI